MSLKKSMGGVLKYIDYTLCFTLGSGFLNVSFIIVLIIYINDIYSLGCIKNHIKTMIKFSYNSSTVVTEDFSFRVYHHLQVKSRYCKKLFFSKTDLKNIQMKELCKAFSI